MPLLTVPERVGMAEGLMVFAYMLARAGLHAAGRPLPMGRHALARALRQAPILESCRRSAVKARRRPRRG